MKAVLIMDIPNSCNDCIIGNYDERYCAYNEKLIVCEENIKNKHCPFKAINPNMIKALRCVASQDAMKDCYRTRYNRDRKEGEPLMTCKPLPDDLSVSCPYQQDEYKTNCEGGECMGWLNEIADMLEGK